MRCAAALCLGAVAMLVGCGGGGGSASAAPPTPVPVPTPQPDTFDHYAPALFGYATHGVVTTTSGSPYSEWTSNGRGVIEWGGGAEFWDYRDCASGRYVWINGYGTNLQLVSPVEHVKDVSTINGVSVDLVADCGSHDGAAYAPFQLPASGIVVIEQWFYFWDSPSKTTARHLGYWKTELLIGQSMTDQCWRGAGSQTRPVIRQREAWWDDVGGWIDRADGTMLPWFNGQPNAPITITYKWESYLGRDAGQLWGGGFLAGPQLCLRDVAPS